MSAPRIVAGIDTGTNSIKCLVARVQDGRILEKISEERITTRLGEGVDRNRRLTPDAIRRTCDAIAGMAHRAREKGAEGIRAASTSAMRDADNAGELIACVKEAAGVDLEVIPGEEEARLGYLAVHGVYDDDAPLATFDIGGGSTEWVLGRGQEVEFRRSIDLGAVRVTDLFLHGDPPAPGEVDAARARIAEAFSAIPDAGGRKLIGMGGTLRTMAAVARSRTGESSPMEGYRLEAAEVDRQVRCYAERTAREREDIPGMERDRADIILGGALLARACIDHAKAGFVTVSDLGLRYGLILSLAGGGG